MKNYQKNSRNPSVPFSCMLEQLIPTDQVISIKWHLNSHIWSLNLNLVFKPTPFNLLLGALAQNTFILPCHSMHHIVHCIDRVSSVFAGVVPSQWTLYWRCDRWHWWRLNVIFRSARQAKPPCSFRYNPTFSLLLSFTALGQQRFNCYLLR